MATPGSSSSSSAAAAEKSAFVLVENLKHEFEWYAFNISDDVEVNKPPPSILHYSIWKDFHQDHGSKAVVKFKPPSATVKIEEEELGHCWAILGLEDNKKKTIYRICFEDQMFQLTEDKAVVKSVGRLSRADVLTSDPTGKTMWESLDSMPNYLSYLNAHIVPLSDKVYCLGGLTEVNHDHDQSPWAMSYDRRLEAWQCLPDPPRLPKGGLVDGIFSTSATLGIGSTSSTAPRLCIVVGLPQQGLIQFYYADTGEWVEEEFRCCRFFHPKDLCGKPVAVGNTLYWYVVGTKLLGGYDLQSKTWSVGHIAIHDDWDYVKDDNGYKDPPPSLAHIGGDMFCLLWVSPQVPIQIMDISRIHCMKFRVTAAAAATNGCPDEGIIPVEATILSCQYYFISGGSKTYCDGLVV